MSKSLVIVESPTKAKTIGKYLGSDYEVMASIGHIKDLPKDQLGVDLEHGFEPEYDVSPDKVKVVKDIKSAAKKAEQIFLASDPDREGEAIAAHLAEELGKGFKGKLYRLLLFEITKNSVIESLKTPGELNFAKYEAQKARRVLDRLVGYQISPLLWQKVRFGLSAGRVQSVAVRLVCEREAEVVSFKPVEYWKIAAHAQTTKNQKITIRLTQHHGKAVHIPDEASAQALVQEAQTQTFIIKKIVKQQRQRHPVAPFITSTLQQEASRKLGFSSTRTMRIAQQLFEGVNEDIGGLITYMRTDSLRISETALAEVREMIAQHYGKEFVPEAPRQFKTKKAAKTQDAHEAIRPTTLKYPPSTLKTILNRDQQKLYELIWNRFVASQMASALIDQTSVEIEAGPQLWRVSGSVISFLGFLKLYEEGKDDQPAEGEEDENQLPELREGEKLDVQKLLPTQHFTEPPPRYNAATLIKDLEEKGIGRPSTFASIMETIEKRLYVEKDSQHRFHPTPTGKLVNDLLVENFPAILDVTFTAQLENSLDEVEAGKTVWNEIIGSFYHKFHNDLELAKKSMRDVKKEEIPTEIICENCGHHLVIKWGKNGEFLACSNYPECKTTAEFRLNDQGKPEIIKPDTTDQVCDKCGKPFLVKNGRYGKFLACSNYPECKNTKPMEEGEAKPIEGTCEVCGSGLALRKGRFGPFIACANYPTCKYIKKEKNDTGLKCPKCKNANLLQRKSRWGKFFYGCANYPKCDFSMWSKPIAEACPQCQFPYLGEKQTKKEGRFLECPQEGCGYRRELEDEIEETSE